MNFSRTICLVAAFFTTLAVSAQSNAQDWVYVARQGDTLWDLCIRYTSKSGCWMELGNYNNISDDRVIAPGSEIRIPRDWLLEMPVVGQVESVLGDVLYDEVANNKTVQLVRGQSLRLGSRITSGQGTARISLGNRRAILVRPNTVLELDTMSSQGEPGQSAEMFLERGNVEVEVKQRSGSRFEIRTPSAIAAVRGTRYRVNSTTNAGAFMRGEVLSGAVEINAADTVVLPAGYGVLARQGQPADELRKLLPAPVFDSKTVKFILPVQLDWQVSVGAVKWQLDLLPDESDAGLLASYHLAEPKIVLPDLSEGCYKAVVRAIDGVGFNGLESELPFCVIAPLAAPTEITVEPLSGSAGQYRVTWQAPEGARRYRLDVALDEEFQNIISSGPLDTNDALVTVGKHRSFYVRVAAVDAFGNSGYNSDGVAHREPGYLVPVLIGGLLVLGVAIL